MHEWKVMPISEGQRLDVREEDLIENGIYRKCLTYRGGGGYDKFPEICERRLGKKLAQQFIVQLYGCNLDCPYCYVTREGVWGKFVIRTTQQLVDAFLNSNQEVFHLMGGAPALQMKNWPELLDLLFKKASKAVFHSDLMLSESLYNKDILKAISYSNTLYAINIKGLDEQDWFKNTRMHLDKELLWENWRRLEELDVPAYVTFTGINKEQLDSYWKVVSENGISVEKWRPDSFVIDLIDYNALPYVDSVSWGRRKLQM